MKLAILLTATIKVQCVGGNFTTNERADMYRSTLRYYSNVVGKKYPVIFCENSDFDLSEFKKEFNDCLDIEWIQLLPSDNIPWIPSKGKAYNEYLMIKEGILRSVKLKDCTHFMKITGRYAMTNIQRIINEIYRRGETKLFMGDIKDTNLYQRLGRKSFGHWGDSRFWVAQIEYYKNNLINCYNEMDDSQFGKWAEHWLLNFARNNRHNKNYIFRFQNQVIFNGITGMRTSEDLAAGKYRQDSLGNLIKAEFRHVLRVLFPNWWF